MGVIITRSPWKRQPQGSGRTLAADYRNALLAYVPSLHGTKSDLLGRTLVAGTAATLDVTVGQGGIAGNSLGFGNHASDLNPTISIPSDVTLISIQKCGQAAQTGWHTFDSDTSQWSHFLYNGGWYTSMFSSSRWLNGVAISGHQVPHVVVVTASGTNRAAYFKGVLVGSTSSGGTPQASIQRIGGSYDDSTYVFDGDTYGLFLIPRALTASEIAARFSTPETAWAALFSPIQSRIWVPSAGGGSGSTGTLATTNAADTSSAAGTTTIVGTLAKTNANDTSSASGTTTILGALAKTNANDTSSASGSPIVNGSLAKNNENDTVSASGSVGNSVSGSLAKTNANDTVSAAGTTTVVGSLAKTNANDSVGAAGTTTVKGTLATTNADDSVSASGAAGTVTGTVATTNANDTVSAEGWAVTPNRQTSGAPGPRQQRYVVYINGKRYIGSLPEIERLVAEFAEEQAEKAVTAKPTKKPRIKVEAGRDVGEKPSDKPAPKVEVQIQQQVRDIYAEAYARAIAQLELDEEEDIISLL